MFFTNGAIFLLGLSLVVLEVNGNAVNFIDPCPIDDNACVLKSSIKALPYVAKGVVELNISASDPMKIDHLTGETGDLKLAFNNLTVMGISKCILIKVDRIERLKIYLVTECPISAIGIYEVGGKFIHIDIFGKGNFKFDTEKLRIEVNFTLKITTGKDGKEYYKIVKFDYKFDPVAPVFFDFENLFDGDEKKAEPVRKIIHETGKDLLSTLGLDFITEIVKREVDVVNSMFHAVPIKQLELP